MERASEVETSDSATNAVASGAEEEGARPDEAAVDGGVGSGPSTLTRISERVRGWWAGVSRRAPVSRGSRGAPRRLPLLPASLRTAGLVVWAPTALVCAAAGALLVTVFIAWVSAWVQGHTAETGRVLVTAAFSSSTLVFLVWFGANPRTPATVQSFLRIVKVMVVLLGLVGLTLAVNLAASYFLTFSPLEPPGVGLTLRP